ncbi:uncharacterized protein LOC655078 [Tribolium castaneum]|uniref:Small ribosomal subunit protein mS38 n=1 Tax=Tribolium castaneum TaxID=7070 RepID=D6X024_TRICA|nr:PREDICTED: uncharacterized protein LOC655078 isoform X2 [Tribolium castaneum]XP_966665.1 PREDICTED: uncharacterized protein LOC655079 isoform X2 [Tribolium castaneum]EFA10137.1 hypothetical protein TcasGA2_TC012323 [Tribolium castaneum]KYB25660.1 hypothetical protein TcasGA2_TC034854 [Tribolium castaneum]|eukprot:XP_966664.1 PREDICTED: uncharacterized protein LOC655078 isoform X2 [Tribolium castaneum]
MACLTRILRLNQFRHCLTFARNLTSNNAPVVTSLVPQVSLTNNPWIWQKNDKVEAPKIKNIVHIDLPNGLRYVPPLEDPSSDKEIELPTINGDVTKEAARLIVIRRRKMKRHKLKKLRKRMKFEWAKKRQRREWNKEKLFQAELIKQCKEGEAFSAEKYVEERLAKLREVTALKNKVFIKTNVWVQLMKQKMK